MKCVLILSAIAILYISFIFLREACKARKMDRALKEEYRQRYKQIRDKTIGDYRQEKKRGIG